MVKQIHVNTEVQGFPPIKRRGWQYFTDCEEAMVEVPPAGAGGRGSQLRCGESIPIHHPHQYTGGCAVFDRENRSCFF